MVVKTLLDMLKTRKIVKYFMDETAVRVVREVVIMVKL